MAVGAIGLARSKVRGEYLKATCINVEGHGVANSDVQQTAGQLGDSYKVTRTATMVGKGDRLYWPPPTSQDTSHFRFR